MVRPLLMDSVGAAVAQIVFEGSGLRPSEPDGGFAHCSGAMKMDACFVIGFFSKVLDCVLLSQTVVSPTAPGQ